ncbi:caspase family protein [Agrobacterium tumefaciens]|uniref:caspase family protein n=1 Tax=Agrobacterium tumefaciens TaxID=358 RepID=UPI001FAA61B8|nr:caspase family protein [Agrobacterium tumefaciens]UNZ52846.1 caspase family protein [Agrobacterium tumefaciens]
MINIAILVGNIEYRNLSRLECCHDDLVAMKELLEHSQKYERIEVIENAESDALKTKIREISDRQDGIAEILFYFTGHGCQLDDDFYFCATNFDSRRPNETGISNTELHTLLKLADADLVVKIVDACNSGTLLVKADTGFAPQKHGFKNLIQISSCLDSQFSLTGDPLSLFTEKFISAALRKDHGQIYYTDLIYTLRDEFLQNDSQTPFFVSQGTGRELFVGDASCFDFLREKASMTGRDEDAQIVAEIDSQPRTLLHLLNKAENKIASAQRVASFTDEFFNSLNASLLTSDFADYFEMDMTIHSSYKETSTEGFLIRVLSKEKRADNFVTAVVRREKRRRNPWDTSLTLLGIMGTDQEYLETYDLELNCTLNKAQLRIALTPKFKVLKRLVLVVTCAPSLERCYVFELTTQHVLKDFDEFDAEGEEIVRRWYKLGWEDDTSGVISKIKAKLSEVVQQQLENTRAWLEGEGIQ